VPNVTATSSGTNVNLADPTEREYFANTIALFERHNVQQYAKDTSHPINQARVDGQDITVCMNQRVIDEAKKLVVLPDHTINWDIVDIGEGHRTVPTDIRQYEEEIFDEITTYVDELVEGLSPYGLRKI
jgi:hypothetical protein